MNDFQSLGQLSVYNHKEFYESKSGYILNDLFGGPTATKYLENFEAREDDVLVVSFPKTGTTWLQEIVYLIGSNLDFNTAKTVPMMERFPFVEMMTPKSVDVMKMTSPRFLKFHYAYSMLPQSVIEKKCKILCPIRNPKDTIVSYYHFSKVNELIGFTSDFDTFVDHFVNDRVLYGPFWKFILEFWDRRNQENVFLVEYEEMIQDLPKVIKDVAKFLGKNLNEDEVMQIAEFCSFDSMKKNFHMDKSRDKSRFNSTFFRKGKVGDWKNHLSEEMNNKVDEYLRKHFNGSDIKFIYE